MKAKELLDAGHLSEAIEELNREVKAHPTDSRQRIFLFELLCFAGDYARARRQLDVIGTESAAAEAGVQIYRSILTAEEARHRLISDGLRPDFLFPPPAYVLQHLEAINRLRERQPEEARNLLEESANGRPSLPGSIDGQAFADFRDADDLIAPFLELIVHDKYVWLPFDAISRVQIAPPKQLRDLLWIPATVEPRHGRVGEVFVPVLYAGSTEHADDRVKLGRMTDWQTFGDGLALGVGQRLFFADEQERAMLEVRELRFDTGRDAA